MSTLHVVPLNDIREHEDSADCWCKPNLNEGVWIHNSMDGRELLESLNLQCAEILRKRQARKRMSIKFARKFANFI